MKYMCELVKDFNGVYYANLTIDGVLIEGLPEYVSCREVLSAIKEKTGISLTLKDSFGKGQRLGRKTYFYAEGEINDVHR